MHRFFVEGVRTAGDEVALSGSDAHKARDVLRLRDGDPVEIADSASQAFAALVRLRDGGVAAVLRERLAETPDEPLRVDVAQAIPKGQKMDFVVEKLTELGVRRILPFVSERSVARDPGATRLDRWRRLAQTAALQCGRRAVPEIAAPRSFDGVIESFGTYDAVLFAWELAAERPLRETLPPAISGARRVLAMIGPEGGFSHQEAGRAVAAGAHALRLGPRVLRTETAALVLLAILAYTGEAARAATMPGIGTTAS